MNDSTILTILKADLHISVLSYDGYLQYLIQLAHGAIREEGITIDTEDDADGMLVENYAAWLYRSRDNNTGMPRYLRWMLNNRLMAEKAGERHG